MTLLVVGKTASADVRSICADYTKRVNRYTKFEEVTVEHSKLEDARKAKEKEGEALLKKIAPSDFVVLLDNHGRPLSSEEFSAQIANWMNQSQKHVCFVVGGAYGFSEAVYTRANYQLSLSRMTFSHQIVRALFMEQLYRAFTILHNEPYHHA